MRKYLPIVLVFLFGLGIGIIEGRLPNPHINPISKLVLYVLSPLQKATDFLASLPSKSISYLRLNSSLRAENELLKQVLEEYKLRLSELEENASEVQRLRALLSLKEQLLFSTIPARVIGRVPGSHTFVINKGQKQGVKVGKAVITPDGLVGQVIKSEGNTAIVMTITHPKSGVGAIVQASREAGIIQGRGDNILILSFLPPNAHLKPGDQILTSGMGDIYPKGIPIGTVIRVLKEKSTSSLWAEVEPSVNFNRIEEVLVMK
jgi:rod shape-determining protein MreC